MSVATDTEAPGGLAPEGRPDRRRWRTSRGTGVGSLPLPRLGVALLVGPAVLFFGAFLIAPIVVVIQNSLEPSRLWIDAGAAPALDNYLNFLTRRHYVNVLIRTLRLSLIATVVSVVVGYAAALVLRRVADRLGTTTVLVLALPILSGPIVIAMGWMIMLTGGGMVGRGLGTVGGIFGLSEGPVLLLGTDIAVVLGMVHFNLAFVILTLLGVLLRLDVSLEEAAASLGANAWRTFLHVILPMSRPGLVTATVLAFTLSASAFVTPHFLGHRSRLVMTTQIAQFMRASFDQQMAATGAVILLVVTLVIVVTYDQVVGRRMRN